MAGNIELSLLTRVVEEQDFHTLGKLKIDESYFFTPEAREVFRFLRDTFNSPETAGLVPTLDFLRYKFPSLHLSSPPDAVPVLCQQLRQEKMRSELLSLAQTINDRAPYDIVSALAEIRSKSIELSAMSEVGNDLSMSNAYTMLLNQYETVQNLRGLIGIPYPWDALNEATQGMQGGQFIVMFGRPKSMKTWVTSYIGKHAYIRARKRVLFYTMEMNVEQVAARIACLFAEVDYNAFRSGKLQPEAKNRVFYILQQLQQDEVILGNGARPPYFLLTSSRGTRGGVSWLQSKIRETDPDLVIVDGMYLMHDDRGGKSTQEWQRVMHISRDLKMLAQEFNIPLIGVTQANRTSEKSRGEDLTELAFSDSLGQDADAVFRASRVTKIEENIKRTYVYLSAPGLREGVFDGIVIRGEPATSFDYVRTMVPEDSNADYEEKKERSSAANTMPQRSTFSRQQFVDPRINNTHMR